MIRGHDIGRTFADDPSALQQIEMIDHLQRRLDILLDQQHRQAAIDQQPDPRQQIGDQPRRQTGGWLVQHQYARAGQQRPPDGQHLPLAAGKRGALVVAPLGQTGKELEHLGNTKDVPAGYIRRRTHQAQILIDRQFDKDVLAFRHQRQAAPTR